MHDITVKGILSAQNGMNLYRGCQHGCIYCDSRSRCYQMDHPFEDVAVKENALELLADALRRKRRPCMIATGSMSDPYMPLEDRLRLTRRALELILRCGFGASVITKSDRVLRDLDLWQAIHSRTKAVVQMTLTTFDPGLCRILEPGVCNTQARLAALRTLRDAGIPTVVWLCPILPFLNDRAENLDAILDGCIEAGVRGVICFGMGVTLREGSREYFYAQLDRSFPGLKEEYIRRYGGAYLLESPDSRALTARFHRRCEAAGIWHDNDRIFQYLRELDTENRGQLSFFDETGG